MNLFCSLDVAFCNGDRFLAGINSPREDRDGRKSYLVIVREDGDEDGELSFDKEFLIDIPMVHPPPCLRIHPRPSRTPISTPARRMPPPCRSLP